METARTRILARCGSHETVVVRRALILLAFICVPLPSGGCDRAALPPKSEPANTLQITPGDAPGSLGAAPGNPGARNLVGSHTTRVSTGCTLYVKPTGSNGKSGRTLADALRTPNRAVSLVKPGDVVCFGPGTYPPLNVADVHGTAAAPVVFRALSGGNGDATFTSNTLSDGASVFVTRSDYIHVYDLRLAESLIGIGFFGSTNGRIEGLRVESIGQAAIHVGGQNTADGSERFLGTPSHDVDVIGNTIRDTGKVKARSGEGVYVGTGGVGGDDTHDIFVAYNTIEDVRAEGIEVKAYTYNAIVRGNVVSHGSHFFHAAITVAVTPRGCAADPASPIPPAAESSAAPASRCTAPADYREGNYLVEDNLVFAYTTAARPAGIGYGGPVAGIGIGHGNTIVRNNLVWDIPGGNGIQTYTTFGNPAARRVQLEDNTVWNPSGRAIALHEGDEGTGVTDQLGDVTLAGNVTNDGSAGSAMVQASQFVGPVTGRADAGAGPGGGFRRVETAHQVSEGSHGPVPGERQP